MFIFIIPFHGTLSTLIHQPDSRVNVGIISTNYKHVETFLTAPEVWLSFGTKTTEIMFWL